MKRRDNFVGTSFDNIRTWIRILKTHVKPDTAMLLWSQEAYSYMEDLFRSISRSWKPERLSYAMPKYKRLYHKQDGNWRPIPEVVLWSPHGCVYTLTHEYTSTYHTWGNRIPLPSEANEVYYKYARQVWCLKFSSCNQSHCRIKKMSVDGYKDSFVKIQIH